MSRLYDREKPEADLRAMTAAQLERECKIIQRDVDRLRVVRDSTREGIERAIHEMRHESALRYLQRVAKEQRWRS